MAAAIAAPMLAFALPCSLHSQTTQIADNCSANVTSQQTAALVTDLGSDNYAHRLAARRALLAAGEPSRGALEKAADRGDAELQASARVLLAALDSAARQSERQALEDRLASFLDDENSMNELSLPAWPRFREAAGGGRAARELYCEALRAEPLLLAAIDGDPKALNEALHARAAAISRSLSHPLRSMRVSLSPGRIAAVALAASVGEGEITPASHGLVYSLVVQRQAHDDGRQGAFAGAMNSVVSHWIEAEASETVDAAYYKLLAAQQIRSRAGLAPALRLLKAPGARPHHFQQALTAICRWGDKRHLPQIEPLLANASVCETIRLSNVTYTTQIGDAALATLIHLTGQDAGGYKFDRIERSTTPRRPPLVVRFEQSNDAGRKRAIEQWQRWKAGQRREDAQPATD